MNSPEGLERNAQAQLCGGWNSIPESRPAPRTSRTISNPESARRGGFAVVAKIGGALAQTFAFQDFEGGQPGAHGQSIFAEGGSVDDGALERTIDRIVNAVGHQDRAAGDEAAAEGFGEDDHVGLEAVAMRGEEGAGAKHAGLDFIEDEERSILMAELLRRRR